MTDEQEGQLPVEIVVEDLEAIADPVERRRRIDLSTNENIAPFPEPVFLMHDDRRTLYGVGWSRYDLLVEMIHDDGRVLDRNGSLGSYATHAPWYLNEIDPDVLKQLRRNRPTIILRPPSEPQAEKAE